MILDIALHTEYLFTIDAINTAHSFYWDECYSYHGEYHNFPEIVYIQEGEVKVTENERIYQMKKGDWILHDAMEFHSICSAGGTHPHVLIISFYTPGVLPDNIKNGVFTLLKDEQVIFENLFARIYDAYHNKRENIPAYPRQLLALELSVFIIKLSGNQSVEHKLYKTKNAIEYKKIVEAMQNGINDNMTLEGLSKECHVSVSYIKSLFKRHLGISPKHYYTILRRAEAIRLLTNGVPVGEVSEIMNFSSPNYCSTFMKKQLGMSIGQYLKSSPTAVNKI